MGNEFKIQKLRKNKSTSEVVLSYNTVKSNANIVSKIGKMNSYRVLFSESYIVSADSTFKQISLLLYRKF